MKPCLVLAGAFLFSLGCDGGGGTADGGVGGSASFTNRAIVTGDQVGLDLDLPSKLSRTIPVVINGPQLTGTSAYLGRLSATENSGTLLVPVTNVADHWQCWVQASIFETIDQNGVSLGTTVLSTYMYGSVGQNSHGFHTNTCVEPGGTGYFFEYVSGAVYTSLGSLHLELFTVDGDYRPPVTSVVPLSYQVTSPDQRYTITVANQGPVVAKVSGGYVIYLNDSDTPVFQGSTIAVAPGNTGLFDLGPGASGQLLADSLVAQWTGKSTKQIVLVDFDAWVPKGSSPDRSVAAVADDEARAAAVSTVRAAQREQRRNLH
jgi:hypothetical protein